MTKMIKSQDAPHVEKENQNVMALINGNESEILTKIHVSSINIRWDRFFDPLTFWRLPMGMVGT